MKDKILHLEKVASIAKATSSREVATRETLQSQLLELRFEKAKAFREIENVKVCTF